NSCNDILSGHVVIDASQAVRGFQVLLSNNPLVAGMVSATLPPIGDPPLSTAAKFSTAQAFLNSAESRVDEVNAVYQHYLGRAADPAGLSFWAFGGGAAASLDSLTTALLSSGEYAQRVDPAHGG